MLATFLSRKGISHLQSAPYHTSSNGEAKRAVRTFKEGTKTLRQQSGSLNQKLSSFLLSYRTTPHSTTGHTPAELMMGRNLHTRLDVFKPNLGNRIQQKASPLQATSKPKRSFNVGEPVLVKDYRSAKETWTHGVITQTWPCNLLSPK